MGVTAQDIEATTSEGIRLPHLNALEALGMNITMYSGGAVSCMVAMGGKRRMNVCETHDILCTLSKTKNESVQKTNF